MKQKWQARWKTLSDSTECSQFCIGCTNDALDHLQRWRRIYATSPWINTVCATQSSYGVRKFLPNVIRDMKLGVDTLLLYSDRPYPCHNRTTRT